MNSQPQNDYDIQTLPKTGVVTITYPSDLRRSVVSSAVDSWPELCKLPLDLRSLIGYSDSSTGVGLECKTGGGNAGDRKENFDVALKGEVWLRQMCQRVNNDKVTRFVDDALNMVSLLEPTIFEFARRVEEELGIKGFLDDVKASADSFFVRFIHYPGGRSVGEETCVAHTDQSCFTFHLYESHPGLQCFSFTDRKWQDMPVSAGQTVIFSAMQFQYRSQGKIRALSHRVIASEETASEAGDGRYSAVCFIQLKNVKKYRKEVFGRLQEMLAKHGADYTYDMKQEQFDEMFA